MRYDTKMRRCDARLEHRTLSLLHIRSFEIRSEAVTPIVGVYSSYRRTDRAFARKKCTQIMRDEEEEETAPGKKKLCTIVSYHTLPPYTPK